MGQWLELFRTLKNLDASPQTPGFGAQSKVAFPVNSQLWEEAP
jgi:hypothetical protein